MWWVERHHHAAVLRRGKAGAPGVTLWMTNRRQPRQRSTVGGSWVGSGGGERLARYVVSQFWRKSDKLHNQWGLEKQWQKAVKGSSFKFEWRERDRPAPPHPFYYSYPLNCIFRLKQVQFGFRISFLFWALLSFIIPISHLLNVIIYRTQTF